MLDNFDASKEKSIKPFVMKGNENIFNLTNVLQYEQLENLSIPMSNILLTKYKDVIDTNLTTIEFTDKQFTRYKYKPKTLSYDLYESVELWYLLLSINNMTSVTQFTQQRIKVYDPAKLEVLYDILQNEVYKKQKKENGL